MEQMKTFIKIPLGALKNEEFFQVGDQTLVAIESNNAEALKLRGVVNLFVESLAAGRTKTELQRMHPLSSSITGLAEHIDDVVMAVMNINKGHKRTVPAEQKSSAVITVPFIEKSLSGFLSQNSFVKSEWLKTLFSEMDSNNTLSAAHTAMSLKPLLDDLRQSHTELVAKRNQRTREKLPQPAESNLAQIQHAKRMLRNLFTAIETNALLEPELNYKPLIANINSIVSEVMRVVNMRRSARVSVELKSTTPEAVNTSGAATVSQTSSVKPSL